MLLLGEIIVEAAMIIATIVATTCLLLVVVGFILQYRAQRISAPSSISGPRRQLARAAERSGSAQHALVHRS
jgi:hypothetical protein